MKVSKLSKKMAVGLTGIASAVVMAAGMAVPANVFADTRQAAAVDSTNTKAESIDQIQILDSDGNELSNIKVTVTAVLSDGTVITEDISSTDYESDYWDNYPRMASKVLKVSVYPGKAEYTLHFTEIPEGYELPSDVVYSVSCSTYYPSDPYIYKNTKILSADVTVEIGEDQGVLGLSKEGLRRIVLRKKGETVEATGWMPVDHEQAKSIGPSYYVGRDGKRYQGWHYMTEKEGVSSPAWMYFKIDGEEFATSRGALYTGFKRMRYRKDMRLAPWYTCYFGTDGRLRTGWQKIGAGTENPDGDSAARWSYFGEDGSLRKGWQKIGKGTSNPDGNAEPHWSYFGDNGWLRTGWVQLGMGTSEPDGNSEKHWSYFGDNGWLRTNWMQFGKGTSEPDGNSEKHWSYFGANGWLRTNWVQFGKGTSEPDGNTAKHWSYFGPNGWLRTGWQTMGAGTSNPDGNSPVHKSYFGSNGWLRTGKQTIDGKQYVFGNNGWLK